MVNRQSSLSVETSKAKFVLFQFYFSCTNRLKALQLQGVHHDCLHKFNTLIVINIFNSNKATNV